MRLKIIKDKNDKSVKVVDENGNIIENVSCIDIKPIGSDSQVVAVLTIKDIDIGTGSGDEQ